MVRQSRGLCWTLAKEARPLILVFRYIRKVSINTGLVHLNKLEVNLHLIPMLVYTVLLLYSGKFSWGPNFVLCYLQLICGFNFRSVHFIQETTPIIMYVLCVKFSF